MRKNLKEKFQEKKLKIISSKTKKTQVKKLLHPQNQKNLGKIFFRKLASKN